MLTFTCGVCRTTLRAPEEKAGGLVRCPQCKQTLRVPSPQTAELVGAGASSSSSAASSPGQSTPSGASSQPGPSSPGGAGSAASWPAPPVPPVPGPMPSIPPPRQGITSNAGGRRYGFNCQYCSSRLEAQDGNAGQSGQCPTCGNEIIVPILDRYGRLIDPMTGKVLKQDPHPVHAYAAAGERAPKIVRKPEGGHSIQCPRCRSMSAITANNCGACGMPFTMEGTTIEATGSSNGYAVASLVLGIIGLPTFFCFAVPPILAIIFGGIAYAQVTREGGGGSGKGMAIAGMILGALGLAFFALFYVSRW